MTNNYKVGYKQPPKETQFQKGKSGNPRGRPKGVRNLKTDLVEEFSEQITIMIQGSSRKISKQRGLIKAAFAKALKGDMRALALILNMHSRLIEPDAQLHNAPTRPTPADEEIIEAFLEQHLANLKGDTDDSAA